ncbi:outer membrane protein assembly factor BamD [Sulfurovum sp. bin170]|uniref:outer membrane protein assembly factor BamD n=1 Tax=Sulfurovum sp. bin170 TaxID=2695268 RepID=UPI0013E0376F|nr:outer membrane protein assembly factor BamD [Sulfurovum sp. bin170]NEW59885.1 outer membrane protein assembly factor BamD [Sulfurovum sp. bin170]
MLTNYKKSFLLAILLAFFTGCADKDAVKEYDKPALYWYKNIIKSLASSNFDKADNYYISLRSEHMRSPLLPTATLILAQVHMEDETYLMADYYLDEYIQKHAAGEKIELANFLKIKAAFLGVKDINKDQKLMIDTLKDVDAFTKEYPNSIYRPTVDTLKVRLHMAQYLLNQNISRLYGRIGKDKASKLYSEKNAKSALNSTDIEAPQEGFLDKLFN